MHQLEGIFQFRPTHLNHLLTGLERTSNGRHS
jgi:hypothetical protein